MIVAVPPRVRNFDATDLKILALLSEDARQSAASIAERVPLSETGVRRRIAFLKGTGVIVKFTTIMAHEKVGPLAEAFVLIKLQPHANVRAFVRRAVKLANIREGSQVTGRFDSLLRVRAADNDAIGDIANRIKGWPEVNRVETMIAQYRQRDVAGSRAAINESRGG